ncbi:HAD-IG family 5'-nucleotidase [Vulgatibacter incomptus]|uniref:HAD superfamily (Subfamily IG) hydrolase, 5'-Nucleotidase n=1 Tax=Vulgatibacter incomptus TaxID=1391653 RepID=A0A0K1PDK0_9BACT|nr:HAD-IG family 5'-nucleotidase [Vulgatibacter incomptus]AKU91595.1 HAD superfamily (Subfamily IG) hydrolase, 5'-Nucleotidase [Vulgatibacter incomptus]
MRSFVTESGPETPAHREIPRERRIYVNRNLRMDRIEAVGFDMDYTLAIYRMRRIEQLSFDMTIALLVRSFGYPEEILSIRYDPEFVVRGLVVDKERGNLLKMDRFNYVGRVYHGRKALPREERWRLYRDEKIRAASPRYAWIDTLFALPEASIYAEIIELLEPARRLDYGKLYDDIREAIDTVHRDGSLKSEIQKDLDGFVVRDPELGPALHKLRSSGKKLFLLTNSLWDYTSAVMTHLLDGVLPEYPSWRAYFEYVLVGGAKPRFFTESHPLLELDPGGGVIGKAEALEKGKAYQGGNLVDFEKMMGIGGEKILYVGDHIYGDIVRSKKSSLWRTCMVVEELEVELEHLMRHADELGTLAAEERRQASLEDDLNLERSRLNALDRRLIHGDLEGEPREALERTRAESKRSMEQLRRSIRETSETVSRLSGLIDEGFNRYWGLTFKEGPENSRFGEQIEDYACIYTSRVSNLLFSSPMQYFRAPRALMPHEVGLGTFSVYGTDDRRPGDRLGGDYGA